MSKRKKSGPPPNVAGPSTEKFSAPAKPRTRVPAFAPVAGVLAVIALGWWLHQHNTSDTAGGFPPPKPPPADAAVTHADFLGADVCASCHQSQYELWKGSTHGNAGGSPSPALVKAPFDGRPIRLRDAVVTPFVGDSGYVFRIAQKGRAEVEFRVHAVVGGGHMAGGGTQGFFGSFPDGTLRFLPFDYSVTGRVWFCATAGRADRGLVPISPAIALAD